MAPRSRPAPLRPTLRLLAAAAALAASAPALAQAHAHAQTQAQAPAQPHAQSQTQPQPQTKAEEEQTASPEHTMPPVIVRARRLARDGVSESEAYTTRGVQVAGKTPRALREIPQSVSVFTEQRLRDQAQVDGARVLEWMPGVFNGRSRETDSPIFLSRGFALNNISIDGSLAGTSFWQAPGDLSAYDQVEVLRGPNGLFSGGGYVGNPSGQINFARKRPQDKPHTQGEAALGSWKQYRATVDVNRRLLADGSLGVRLVASQANREYFFRTARRKNTTLYGVAEWQPLAALTLTAGMDMERRRSIPWINGLPLRGDGTFPGYSRRMSTVSPWSRWAGDTLGFFTEAAWQFRDGWKLKAAYNWRREERDWDFGFLSGYVDPVPGSAQVPLYQDAQRRLGSSNSRTMDVTLTGGFDWLGRRHDLIAGIDWRWEKSREIRPVEYAYDSRPTPHYPDNPVRINPGTLDMTAPWQPAIWGSSAWSFTPSRTWGAHASLRLRLTDSVSSILGGRLSSYHYGGRFNPTYNVVGNGAYHKSHIFTPFFALNWDFNPHASAYVSYTDIFDVNNAYDARGKMVPPTTGANWELGLKTEWMDKRLVGSIALYQTDRKNQIRRDPNTPYPCPASPISYDYCYIADNRQRVRGIELELAGLVRPGLKIALGATLQHQRYVRNLDGNGNPRDAVTWNERIPLRTFRAWADWRLPVAGGAWRLGGGVRANSGYYYARTASGRVPAARVSQGGYAIWDAMLAWQPSPHWSVQLNISNVLDKRYFSEVGLSQVAYGEPRSFMLTARMQF